MISVPHFEFVGCHSAHCLFLRCLLLLLVYHVDMCWTQYILVYVYVYIYIYHRHFNSTSKKSKKLK